MHTERLTVGRRTLEAQRPPVVAEDEVFCCCVTVGVARYGPCDDEGEDAALRVVVELCESV